MPYKNKADKAAHNKQYKKNYTETPATVESRILANRRYQASEKGKTRTLKRLYGITFPQKKAQYELQKGLCALCGLPLPEKISSACADHNHETGQMRGLLHQACNFIVGVYETYKLSEGSVINYLQKYRGENP